MQGLVGEVVIDIAEWKAAVGIEPLVRCRGVARPAVLALVLLAAGAISGCGQQNTYVAPPPPKVDVALPLKQEVIPYIYETGSTVALNNTALVARVSGFLQSIDYKDGDGVKAGTTLFVIEQKPYQLALEQAQAEKASSDASVKQSSADLERQQTLVKKGFATPQDLDKSAAAADADLAKQKQSQADIEQAELNLSYTEVKAPFNGVATARQVSLGQLVGPGGQSELATVVQLNPIYVNFSVSEKEVLRIKADMVKRGITVADLKKLPVEVGLQTEVGYPHRGTLDYISPTVDPSTGTLAVRAVFENAERNLLPGYFVRVRVPFGAQPDMLLVPDRALGTDQSGRYLLVAGKDDIVEQRPVEIGQQVGELRVITSGIGPEDRVDHFRHAERRAGPEDRSAAEDAGAGGGRRRHPMISKFFIERPVLANVIAILMVVIGVVSLIRLPVAQYPNVVPPTVQVTTRYPGASARTVIDTVALPIEQQVNGVENMLYMQSYAASDGSYSLTVTFAIGTDLDQAQVLVQNRVSAALAALPQAVQVQGVNVQKKSTSILQIVTLTSPDNRYDSLYLSNYATISLKDEIARLPGVGNVTVFGAGQYSMRVWLDPDKMQARGLTPRTSSRRCSSRASRSPPARSACRPRPTGRIFQYTIEVSSRLDDPDEFGDVILKIGRSTAISPACATSAASSSGPRPTASSSTSTAARPPAWRSSSRRGPTRSTSPRGRRAA